MRGERQGGDGAERLFAGAVWLAMVTALAVYVARYGSNVPFMEDWELVPVLTGHRPLTFAWLGEQILEHRYVLAKALLQVIFLATGDFRAPMYIDALLLSGLALAFMAGSRRLRGRTSFADAFFPVALLHWGHAETLIFFIQICFVLPIVLFSAVMIAIATRAWEGRTAVVAAIAVAVALLPLNGGIGMLMAPPLVAWMAFVAVARWRGGVAGRRDAVVLTASAVVTIGLAAYYMVGLQFPTHIVFVPRTFSGMVISALEVLGMAVGPAGGFVWPASGLLVGAIYAIATAGFAFVAWRRPAERLRALGLLACMASACALVAGIAYGRAVMGPGFGFASRYALLSVLGLCCAFLGAVLYGTVRAVRLGDLGQMAMFVCMCAVLWTNLENGYGYGRERRKVADALLAGAAAGAPPALLAERHWQSLYPHETVMADRLVMLRDAGWDPYRPAGGD